MKNILSVKSYAVQRGLFITAVCTGLATMASAQDMSVSANVSDHTAQIAPQTTLEAKDGSAMIVGELLGVSETFMRVKTCLGEFSLAKDNWDCTEGNCMSVPSS